MKMDENDHNSNMTPDERTVLYSNRIVEEVKVLQMSKKEITPGSNCKCVFLPIHLWTKSCHNVYVFKLAFPVAALLILISDIRYMLCSDT